MKTIKVCIHNRDSKFYLMVKLISLITIIEIFRLQSMRGALQFFAKITIMFLEWEKINQKN